MYRLHLPQPSGSVRTGARYFRYEKDQTPQVSVDEDRLRARRQVSRQVRRDVPERTSGVDLRARLMVRQWVHAVGYFIVVVNVSMCE